MTLVIITKTKKLALNSFRRAFSAAYTFGMMSAWGGRKGSGLVAKFAWLVALAIVAFAAACAVLLAQESGQLAIAIIWLTTDKSQPSEIIQRYGLVLSAIAAFGIAVWRSIVADAAKNAAQEANKREAKRAEFDRFQRGAVGLGDEKMSVRIASIITLSDIAHSPDNQASRNAVDLLCAFAKDRSNELRVSERIHLGELRDEAITTISPEDILTAIKAIARVSEQFTQERILISDVYLCKSDLRQIKMSNTSFTNCDFSYANISFSYIDNCLFHFSLFNSARINFTSFLGSTFFRCNMSNCSVINTEFLDSRINYSDMSNMDASESTFTCVEETFANFSGVNLLNSNLNTLNSHVFFVFNDKNPPKNCNESWNNRIVSGISPNFDVCNSDEREMYREFVKIKN